MGVLTLAGKLLWLSRRGYNMLLFGVTQLCSIMSKPSQKMWTAGLRMLGWLRDNYKLGIRFHSNVTDPPCIFYDSGHGQYFSDSKAHHGNIAVFAGGHDPLYTSHRHPKQPQNCKMAHTSWAQDQPKTSRTSTPLLYNRPPQLRPPLEIHISHTCMYLPPISTHDMYVLSVAYREGPA